MANPERPWLNKNLTSSVNNGSSKLNESLSNISFDNATRLNLFPKRKANWTNLAKVDFVSIEDEFDNKLTMLLSVWMMLESKSLLTTAKSQNLSAYWNSFRSHDASIKIIKELTGNLGNQGMASNFSKVLYASEIKPTSARPTMKEDINGRISFCIPDSDAKLVINRSKIFALSST